MPEAAESVTRLSEEYVRTDPMSYNTSVSETATSALIVSLPFASLPHSLFLHTQAHRHICISALLHHHHDPLSTAAYTYHGVGANDGGVGPLNGALAVDDILKVTGHDLRRGAEAIGNDVNEVLGLGLHGRCGREGGGG